MQNDNTKMYEAVKKIKRLRPPRKLLIKGKNDLTANLAGQSKIIVQYLKRRSIKINRQEQSYHPHE